MTISIAGVWRHAVCAGLGLVGLVMSTTGLAAPAHPTAGAENNHVLKLLREPTISADAIVFEYGGRLWRVGRDGGDAHLLVSGMDRLRAPLFSPDGHKIAFTGTYDGNTDVYVVDAHGGQPERLTWHPGGDVAVGWGPKGQHVLFSSHRDSNTDSGGLYRVALDAHGLPKRLPLAEAETGSYSPDGRYLAYVPGFQWEPFWQDYQGGQFTNVWLARLADSSVTRIPNPHGANDNSPMWLGDTVYFLSDRSGAITLYGYHPKSGHIEKVLDNHGFDITSASAGAGRIVYSQFGVLHVFNPKTGQAHVVNIDVAGDMAQRRVHYQKVGDELAHPTISPKGVRAAFEAHGEIVTVPAEHGDASNLTHSPGAMDRRPAWSPDGKQVAYFSDAKGQYDLYIASQNGLGAHGMGHPQRIALGVDNAYYYDLRWSPDSHKVLFSDQKLQLWMVDLSAAEPEPVKIATDNYSQLHAFDARWSPDGRWVVYTKVLDNFLHAAFVYSVADGQTHRITDGLGDVRYPVFGADGKLLYFTVSTDTALTHGWLDMTRMQRPVTRHVYAATLRTKTPSPLAPKTGYENADDDSSSTDSGDDQSQDPKAQSDDHDAKSADQAADSRADQPTGTNKTDHDKAKKTAVPEVAIDFDGLAKRAVALPIDAKNYVGLAVGDADTLYLEKAPLVQTEPSHGPSYVSVKRFKLDKQKTDTLVDDAAHVRFTPDGAKLLYQNKSRHWVIADAKPSDKAKPKTLATDDLRVKVVPQAEWVQMYHDAWRFQRAFFYDGGYHGLDVTAAEKHFAPYLPGIASRDGLNFLFEEMLSYMSVGHMFIRGGHQPHMAHVGTGLLGADFTVDNGRYRISRIYTGEPWNPDLDAPLAAPGLDVVKGDYLLAVNGESLTADTNLYAAFENRESDQVTLSIADGPNAKPHAITVKTIDAGMAYGLRHAAWIEHNRKLVNKLSGGRLGYVYLPDTYWGGYANFNRYFFSQVDKQGVVIDERFNHGGLLADYIIQYLQREPMTLNVTRWGKQAVTPPEAIFGPKVMLINQYSGSGGDALPWYFKRKNVGTLVGKRTWGGLVGIGGFPELMDGGTVTAPNTAVEGLDGTFPVENHGVAPDVEVWQDPARMRQGHDPQLEKAIAIALKQLKANPPKPYQPAPPTDFHPTLPPLPPHGQPGDTSSHKTGDKSGDGSGARMSADAS